MPICIRFDTGGIHADTRNAHKDPPEPVAIWQSSGALTVRLKDVIGVYEARGQTTQTLDPRPSTVILRDTPPATVRAPMAAIEAALSGILQQAGVWEWNGDRWEMVLQGPLPVEQIRELLEKVQQSAMQASTQEAAPPE